MGRRSFGIICNLLANIRFGIFVIEVIGMSVALLD